MSLCAILPVASMLAANATLQSKGFGPGNFSVPAYTGAGASHAALHAWDDPVFSAAVKAIAGVVVNEGAGDPVARTNALIQAQGAKWGAQAPAYGGVLVTGGLYRYTDGTLWSVITGYDTTTFPAHPSTYPALIRQARQPGVAGPWVQPLDALDAYKLVQPFTSKPDTATHKGKTWKVSQGDGAGNNLWEPSVFGWVEA